MAPAKLSQEVAERFGDIVASDDKLLAECISICQIYNITPENLLYKWEALNFKPSSVRSEFTESQFTMDSVTALKAQVQRDFNKETTKKVQPRLGGTGTVTGVASVNRDRIPPFMSRNTGTSVKTQVKVEPRMGGFSGGKVFGSGVVAGPSKVVFKGPKNDEPSRKKRAYRYMYEKVSERSEALDDRIDEFGELIREHYHIAELGDPSASTDEEITIIGRITHDSESDSTSSASTPKLTEATLTLESSRMLGSGSRVPLRFDPALKIRGGAKGAAGVGLFPGAMVALRGKNGGGGRFLVTEVLAMPPLKPSPTSVGLTNTKAEPTIGELPFSMCIASGPYTPDADLNFKPWRNLLQSIKSTKPTVVLLIGPFIDSAHPCIKSGDIDSNPTALFRTHFTQPLRAFLDSSPGSIVLLIPSVRDLISHHAVFPQCELGTAVSGSDPRIHLLPNPARFSINDVTFAACSVDVLFHLRKEEFLKRGEEVDSVLPSSIDDTGTDSMANLCRHLLQQRSFYPIFPVPLDVSHEVNLDVSHADDLKMGDDGENDYAPDVLLVPSRLKHFSKAVYTTIALNPSFLTKGMFSTLDVPGRGTPGGLKERMRVEVVKLEG